ncbi:MAG TPA: cytochrome P450 [Burkholderiales bacterium]|nr:cytochrome P450 [Burkholderiales bacterium]
MTAVHFDPFGEQHRNDPYPAYAELRRRAPVFRVEKTGAYAVSRYADVAFVLRHPELFSSIAMQTTMTSGFTTGASTSGMGISGAEAARLVELLKSLPISISDLLRSRSLIASDPPVHGPMRNLVNRGFTPRRIAELETRIRAIARASLDALEGKSEFDLVTEFSVPLPVTVIAELLGVEPERSTDFKRWSDCAVAGATGGAGALRPETVLQGFSELSTYITGVVEERRRRPQEDLISTLIRAEDGEAGLTPIEVVMFTLLLLVAGNETTTNLLGNALLALMAHPDQLAGVQRDTSRIPALVEEALRYDGPIQFLFRQATQDVEIAGVKIPAGATLMPLIGSANRDDDQFPEADRFDVSRNTQGHLAFGLGIHFCLGASLARLEARVALEELLGRFARFERREPHVEYIDSYLVRGPKHLPLRVEA